MSEPVIIEAFRQAMIIVLEVSGPMLIASIVIGLFIAIFQAATQIHEQTLTFAPKLLVIALILVVGGSWMMQLMKDFIVQIFHYMLY